MGSIIDIVDAEHLQEMLDLYDRAIILFTAPGWCVPCQRLEPHYEKLAEMRPDFAFFRVNADHQEEIIKEHAILTVPTVYFYHQGEFNYAVRSRTLNQMYKELDGLPDEPRS